MKDIFLTLMFNILKNYMAFLPERMKMKVENYKKVEIYNLNDEAEYVIPIRILKQALNYGFFEKSS